MTMIDVYADAWNRRLRDLPQQELTLNLEKNYEREHISCFICHLGHGEKDTAPEYIVNFKSCIGYRISAGLHEECKNLTRKINTNRGIYQKAL